MKRLLKKLWPQTLSGRLALILIAGTLSAQMLTGTIWYDMRYGQTMEMPTRLAAARLADVLAILDQAAPPQRAGLMQTLSSNEFKLRALDAPTKKTVALSRANQAVAELFSDVMHERSGLRIWRLLQIDLEDKAGDENSLFALINDDYPNGHFIVQAQLADGSWLQADIREGQAGMSTAPLSAALDYFFRIYVLRIAVVVLIAWAAVRLAMKPLQVMANAAEELGRNIHSKPLSADGPLEVRKAAQAFNAMQRRIIDNIAERTRFLAAVSHDLRSPITRMKLRTEMIEGEHHKEKFRKDLDEMDAMISATLNVMQDADVHENRQLIDLDSLLTSLQSDLAELGKEIRLSGHAAPVGGYPRSLKRCLQNIVENAVRYGERACVTLAERGDAVQITVDDNGPGIPADMLERVLEPFYRLERSRNAATGGFGLGLSIAATVVQAHRGEITLTNRPEGGLRVTILIPR